MEEFTTKEIEIMQKVFEKNETIATKTNEYLSSKGIFAINVLGAPGIGKTTILIELINRQKENAFVIEGDIATNIDTKKLNSSGISAIQLNTGGACHLDSPCIKRAVEENDLKSGVLYIENIGNLVCPAEFLIGEHIKMLICAVTEGSDKPYKYPLAFEKADIILVNKTDLLPYVDFDRDYFTSGVRIQNKTCPIFFVSGKTGSGFEEVVQWLTQTIRKSLNK